MPKVLILAGDASESLEVMYPYQRLQEEGYDVDIAALQKKRLQFVVHDFVDGFDTYTEKLGYTWPADVAPGGPSQPILGRHAQSSVFGGDRGSAR